jgi:transposase
MARIVDHEGEVLEVRSKVEQFAAIRRDHRIEELSVRALAKRHGVHRRTVRAALESAVPPARKVPLRVAPRLAPYRAAIDEMLRSDMDAPKKQRHTARRVLARLLDEHDAVGMSASAARKPWPKPASRWRRDSCRRPIHRPLRARSIFMTCG